MTVQPLETHIQASAHLKSPSARGRCLDVIYVLLFYSSRCHAAYNVFLSDQVYNYHRKTGQYNIGKYIIPIVFVFTKELVNCNVHGEHGTLIR